MLLRKVATENNINNIGHRFLVGALAGSLQLSSSNTTSNTTAANPTANSQVIQDQQRISNGAIAIVIILIAMFFVISVSTFYYARIRRRRSRRLRNKVELGTASRRLEFSLVSDDPPLPPPPPPSSTFSMTLQETDDSHLAVSRMRSSSTKSESYHLLDTVSSRSGSTKTKSSTNTSSTVPSGRETASSIKHIEGEDDGSIEGDECPPTVQSREPGPQSSIAPPGHVLKIMNIAPMDADTISPKTAIDPAPDEFDLTAITFKKRVRGRMSYADLPRISTDFGFKDGFKIELPYLNRSSTIFQQESSSVTQSTSESSQSQNQNQSQRDSLELEVPNIRKFRRLSTRSLNAISSPGKPMGGRPIPRSTTGPSMRPRSAMEPNIV